MSTIRAIILGIIMWLLGVGVFTLSSLIPILNNPAFQSNLFLSIAIIPIAWFGARYFYRSSRVKFHSIHLSSILLILFILLDALITVPLFILPTGGSYTSFFGDSTFWLIALELFLVIYSYWYFKVQDKSQITEK